MPQDKYVRRNADKLNSEGADTRPYGVGPTMRELRFKEIAETIGAPRSPAFPPTPRKAAMSRAAAEAKANAKEYGSDTQRLQREMAKGTRKTQEYAEMDRLSALAAPRYMQIDMDDAKKQAEDRAYFERKDKEEVTAFGKTALGGTQSNSPAKEDRYRRGMNIKK